MPDFPARGELGRTSVAIQNYGDTMIGEYLRGTSTAPTAITNSAANTAIYFPFTLTRSFLAQTMGVQVTTQSGNMDVGIYDEKGTRLVSMGSTAVAAAGLQVFNIADTWLTPGTYFMAINVDNTTAAFMAIASGSIPAGVARTCGLQKQSVGAVALPSSATFTAYTALNTPIMIINGNATL